MSNITSPQLKEMIDDGEKFVFIDVREPDEYAAYNLGAQNIPLSVFPARMQELTPHKNDLIVVHCKMGGRSYSAQQMLLKSGFNNVLNLAGGADGWKGLYG